MSLKAKVQAAVDTAFKAVGDLMSEGVLTSTTVEGYDFATRQTISSTNPPVTIQVFIEEKQKSSGEGFDVTALMKSGVDLSVYNTLTVGTEVFNIVSHTDNDYTITATLVKEKA